MHAFPVLSINVLLDWGQGFAMSTQKPWFCCLCLLPFCHDSRSVVCLGSLSTPWKTHFLIRLFTSWAFCFQILLQYIHIIPLSNEVHQPRLAKNDSSLMWWFWAHKLRWTVCLWEMLHFLTLHISVLRSLLIFCAECNQIVAWMKSLKLHSKYQLWTKWRHMVAAQLGNIGGASGLTFLFYWH